MGRTAWRIWNEAKFPQGGAPAIFLAVISLAWLPSARVHARSHASRAEKPMNALLRFEANHGQTDTQVKFLARAANYSIFLSGEEADVVLHHEAEPSGPVARGKMIVVRGSASVLRMRFTDSNPPTRIAPFDASVAAMNSFAVRANRSYNAVAYRGLYPGIDIIFRGDQKKIGFQLDLSPGAETNGIALVLDGAGGITLDAAGNAVVHVGESSLVIEKPLVFENKNGQRQQIACGYRVESNNLLRFIIVPPAADEQLLSD